MGHDSSQILGGGHFGVDMNWNLDSGFFFWGGKILSGTFWWVGLWLHKCSKLNCIKKKSWGVMMQYCNQIQNVAINYILLFMNDFGIAAYIDRNPNPRHMFWEWRNLNITLIWVEAFFAGWLFGRGLLGLLLFFYLFRKVVLGNLEKIRGLRTLDVVIRGWMCRFCV